MRTLFAIKCFTHLFLEYSKDKEHFKVLFNSTLYKKTIDHHVNLFFRDLVKKTTQVTTQHDTK